MKVIKITAGNGSVFYAKEPQEAWRMIVNTARAFGQPESVEVLEMSEEEYWDIPATLESSEATQPVK